MKTLAATIDWVSSPTKFITGWRSRKARSIIFFVVFKASNFEVENLLSISAVVVGPIVVVTKYKIPESTILLRIDAILISIGCREQITAVQKISESDCAREVTHTIRSCEQSHNNILIATAAASRGLAGQIRHFRCILGFMGCWVVMTSATAAH